MKFILSFELEKPELPLEYRRVVLSFIKTALTQCNNAKYFENYYKDTIQKDFTWYAMLPKPRFTKETIELSENHLHIAFSVEDKDRSAYILYMALNGMRNKKFSLPYGNSMILQGIKQQPQKMILGSSCIFKTSIGSPLVVREHNADTNQDKYYCVEDKEFDTQLTECIQRQLLHDGFEEDKTQTVEARMVRGKKVVVRHYGQLIDTSAGILEIKAPNYILQHLYQVGMCSRRSVGFGAIEVIAERE